MTRRTLVTGATGFVGSAIVRKLIARGCEVRTIVRAGSDRANIEGLAIDIVEGDIRDKELQRKALNGMDDLFHVAADYRLWVPEPAVMYATNVDATVNLFRAAMDAGTARCVYTSSVATLGTLQNGGHADEATPSCEEQMIGHYKRSKFIAEAAVGELAREEGLPVVIVNPAAPIGPRDRKPTPTGRMVVQAGRGRMPVYVDTGLNVVHVDDVAEGHLLAMENGKSGERYILGAENLTLKNILQHIAALVGISPPRVRLPIPAILPIAHAADWFARSFSTGEPFVTVEGVKLASKKMFFSSARAVDELGYAPRPAAEAIADAVNWYRANGYI